MYTFTVYPFEIHLKNFEELPPPLLCIIVIHERNSAHVMDVDRSCKTAERLKLSLNKSSVVRKTENKARLFFHGKKNIIEMYTHRPLY